MPIQERVDEVMRIIEKELDKASFSGHGHLKIAGSNLDENWLYVTVTPTKAGGSASDDAKLMEEIEKKLSEIGFDDVLLVPAIDD